MSIYNVVFLWGHYIAIDLLYILQVTWLEGHSLAQTVFTNLYLHDPSLIDDRCLKAFSICMLKIVDLIRDRINRAGVFEEVSVIFLICTCVSKVFYTLSLMHCSLTHNLLNFLNGICHYHFKWYQDQILKLFSQQYRAWSECTDVYHFWFQQDKG